MKLSPFSISLIVKRWNSEIKITMVCLQSDLAFLFDDWHCWVKLNVSWAKKVPGVNATKNKAGID